MKSTDLTFRRTMFDDVALAILVFAISLHWWLHDIYWAAIMAILAVVNIWGTKRQTGRAKLKRRRSQPRNTRIRRILYWIVLGGVLYIASGILAYGFALAHLQNEYPARAERLCLDHVMAAAGMGMIGPVGLPFIVLTGDTDQGFQFTCSVINHDNDSPVYWRPSVVRPDDPEWAEWPTDMANAIEENADPAAPFNHTISGIPVHSDTPEFIWLALMMAGHNITNESFPKLRGITYYQATSETCDGHYYLPDRTITVYHCPEPIDVRGNPTTDEFILLHELGHHVFHVCNDNGDAEQYCADQFARDQMLMARQREAVGA